MGFFRFSGLCAVLLLFPAITWAKVFEFGLGVEPEIFAYKELVDPPRKSTETAAFTGGLVLIRGYLAQESFLQLKYGFASGVQSRYDGSSLDGSTAIVATNPLSFKTIEALVSINIMPRFSLIAGYGQREWNRFLSSGTGYREIYTWSYMPIGVSATYLITTPWTLAVEATYRKVSAPKLRVITSETFANGQNSDLELGAIAGYRLVAPIRWDQGPWAVLVHPYYEHSEFGESPAVNNVTLGGDIHEPSSKTDQFGVELLLTYSL